ncbi:MAG: family 3 adenylate cyclase [Ignavibacteria bacterium]|nr:family 3 adenylate cyclase [Ignavibacteria bacterium]
MEQNQKNEYNILYVDDESNNLTAFTAAFRRDYNIFTAISGAEGMEIFTNNDIHVIVTDQRMPNMTGVQFLQRVPDEPDNIRIILTGFSDIESIVEAINTGKVYRYITKPWDKNELKITIDNALETVMLRRNNKLLIDELKQNNEQLEEKVRIRTLEIEKEKAKSDELLLNILPNEIADELKLHGKSLARKHEQVSVLFADIKGFTSIAEILSPEHLVAELDRIFRVFDDLVEKHGLEKIKTIGDAYMCAGGLPISDKENAVKAVSAALDMQNYMKEYKETKTNGNPGFDIRIGIHTGPVVAGVVGNKKFSYDIWGDTVNTAARMEAAGEPCKINISDVTYSLVKDFFNCIHRGKIEAKNKGEINMYFVENHNG